MRKKGPSPMIALEKINPGEFAECCRDKKICVYGGGTYGDAAINFIKQFLDIDYFSDKNSIRFSGKSKQGIPYVDYRDIDIETTVIIIAISSIDPRFVAKFLYKKIQPKFLYLYSRENGIFIIERKNYFAEKYETLRFFFRRLVPPRHKTCSSAKAMTKCLPDTYYARVFSHIKNYSRKYIDELLDNYPGECLYNGILKKNDCNNPYYTVHDGMRKNLFSQDSATNGIYLIGDSRTFGFFSEDRYSFHNLLQRELNIKKMPYTVYNMGTMSTFFDYYFERILSLALKPGDIVFVFCNSLIFSTAPLVPEKTKDIFLATLKKINDYCTSCGAKFVYSDLAHVGDLVYPTYAEWLLANAVTLDVDQFREGANPDVAYKKVSVVYVPPQQYLDILTENSISYLDFKSDIYKENHIFCDFTHFTLKGNRLLVSSILKKLQALEYTINPRYSKINFSMKQGYSRHKMLTSDLKNFTEELSRELVPGKNGCIVMNCNPLTNGHLRLIEHARRYVDTLYLFLLEEEKSEFPFDIRFAFVKKAIETYENVRLLRSSRFLISSMTFPEYFSKASNQDVQVNASSDILLFSLFTAPALKIRTRFVGTEPSCKITKQYNEQLQRLLPIYGIRLVEIPRFAHDGAPISASRARQLLRLGDAASLRELKALVPPHVFAHCSHGDRGRSPINNEFH